MGSILEPSWRQLDIAIIGGGIGGLAAAIALRRAGHQVSIYETTDLVGDSGASVTCAANGSRWLHEWGVNVDQSDAVVVRKLISRDWKTGEPLSVYSLADYEERWGHKHFLFERRRMHSMLKDSALGEGEGLPAKLFVNHKCKDINNFTGVISFEGGKQATHDLIVGADGIGSAVRGILGISSKKRPAESSCLHAEVSTQEAVAAGLVDFSKDSSLQYWGGQEGGWDKIVLTPCRGGEMLSYYCFFPREKGDYVNQAWGKGGRSVEELLAKFPKLDPQVYRHLALGKDIQPWRMWIHDPYPYITRGVVCLAGDAAHPMMPHQSQGACMALEDAAALGILFSKRYFQGDVLESLATYEAVRLPRATKVQTASAKAGYNINERIGFSSNTDLPVYRVLDEKTKLTMEEMNAYNMYKHINEVVSKRSGRPYKDKYTHGLPLGLRLSNGFTVGEEDGRRPILARL